MFRKIDAKEARRLQKEKDALLVCSYDDESKCHANALEGAISLAGLQERDEDLDPETSLVFYCA